MNADVRMGRSAARHLRFALAAVGALTVCGQSVAFAGNATEHSRIAALAQFDLAAGQPRLALARTEGAQGAQSESVAWQRARALMETGQVARARDLLERQLQGQTHRGDAALVLGRIANTEGNTAGASRYFDTAARLGFGETRQQALYELAALKLEADDPDAAGQLLATMEPGYWAALGYMNLAGVYSTRDLNAARPLVALRVALAMSEQDEIGDRSASLRSQLLVRAGYLSYLQEDHEKAIGFFEQVPLDSYHTPRALYLHGLALAARDNHRAAMQSWHRARKYPLAYPGVEDAWLGMGRGYDLSGYLGQAGEAYLAANASYESERVTLKKLADRINDEGAWKALIVDARGDDAQWFLADSRTLTQPRMAYLLQFMEGTAAQEAVSRVSELVDLELYLAEKHQHLNVWKTSLRERLATAPGSAGTSRAELADRAETLRAQIQTLAQRQGDRSVRDELSNTAETLSAVETALTSLERRLAKRDARLAALVRRADAALANVQSLRSQVAKLQERAESSLDRVALAFVKDQDKRMAFALDKTEQQIAHLYEYLALETLERGGR